MDVLSGFVLMTDPSLCGFVSRGDGSRMSCVAKLHFSGSVRVQLTKNLVGPALSLMGIHGSDVGGKIIISVVSKPHFKLSFEHWEQVPVTVGAVACWAQI